MRAKFEGNPIMRLHFFASVRKEEKKQQRK